MPRSTALKNLSALPPGTHAHLQCPFCDYKARSDCIPKHVKDTHTLDEINSDLQYVQINNIVLTSVEKNNGTLHPTGFCFDCFTYIKNKNPTTTDVFDNHECKERKTPAPRKPVNKEVIKEMVKAVTAETSLVLKIRLNKKLNSIFDYLEVDATEGDYEECIFDAIDSGVTAVADLIRERNSYNKLMEKYELLETQFGEKVNELKTVRDSIDRIKDVAAHAVRAKEEKKEVVGVLEAENTVLMAENAELKRQLKALQPEELTLVITD